MAKRLNRTEGTGAVGAGKVEAVFGLEGGHGRDEAGTDAEVASAKEERSWGERVGGADEHPRRFGT